MAKKMTRKHSLNFILMFIALMGGGIVPQLLSQPTPAPIEDAKNTEETFEAIASETYTNAFHLRSALAIRKVSQIQTQISQAHKVVSTTVKNLAMVNRILQLYKDIEKISAQSIERLNEPIDVDGDGISDSDFIDKWKHIKTIVLILGEADGLFGLFKNITTNLSATNDLAMDEKGRIKVLSIIYKDLVKIKSALLSHIRKINREMYWYVQKKKELAAYQKLFSFE